MIRVGFASAMDQAWHYTASDAFHQDETSNINGSDVGDVQVFSSTCVNVGDLFYFGHTYNRFARVSGCVSIAAIASPTVVYEFYDGAAWSQIAELDSTFSWGTTGSQDLIISPSYYDTIRQRWERVSVCAVTAYYVRARVSAIAGGGSGASLTSASVDLSLPSPVPTQQIQKIGRLFEFLDGSRGFDEKASKRTLTLRWPVLDMHDAISLRERVSLTKATCISFPADWSEDTNPMIVIVEPESHVDSYLPPKLHNALVTFLEV